MRSRISVPDMVQSSNRGVLLAGWPLAEPRVIALDQKGMHIAVTCIEKW